MTGIYYVYMIFRMDGTPAYVGKGKGKRWLAHQYYKTSAPIVAFCKAHPDAPRVKIRENLTEEQAFHIEWALIAVIGRSPYGPLLNMTDGGEGVSGFKRSRESIEKSAAAHRGKPKSEETKRKISLTKTGKKMSPEAIRKSAEAHRGLKMSPGSIEKTRQAKLGKPRSEECKAKIRAALLGSKLLAAHRKAISDGNMGRTFSDETRAKISAANNARHAKRH